MKIYHIDRCAEAGQYFFRNQGFILGLGKILELGKMFSIFKKGQGKPSPSPC